MQVWILAIGEDYEGSKVIGVYADKDAAYGDFMQAARDIPFRVDGVRTDPDGSVHVHGGCDWVSLGPYEVLTASLAPAPQATAQGVNEGFERWKREVIASTSQKKFITFNQ